MYLAFVAKLACSFSKYLTVKHYRHDGKSPLELVGVNTTAINWIKFS